MLVNQFSGDSNFLRSGARAAGTALLDPPQDPLVQKPGHRIEQITTKPVAQLSISVVLPCYNEELNIERTIRETQAWFSSQQIDGQVVVTDDGSADGSLALLRRLQLEMPNLKVVAHAKNQGYGASVRSGCDAADKQWIAFMDSDGQFHAEDIMRLIPLTREAQYVTGIREKRADNFQRWLNSRMYNMLVRTLLGVYPADINCGMKIFSKAIWPTIRPVYATGALINGEMFFALKNNEIAWKETLVPHYPRVAGKPTGANIKVILRMFKELWQLKRSRGKLDAKTRASAKVAMS